MHAVPHARAQARRHPLAITRQLERAGVIVAKQHAPLEQCLLIEAARARQLLSAPAPRHCQQTAVRWRALVQCTARSRRGRVDEGLHARCVHLVQPQLGEAHVRHAAIQIEVGIVRQDDTTARLIRGECHLRVGLALALANVDARCRGARRKLLEHQPGLVQLGEPDHRPTQALGVQPLPPLRLLLPAVPQGRGLEPRRATVQEDADAQPGSLEAL
eukprot:5532012-Prymnesium_polylepis.1